MKVRTFAKNVTDKVCRDFADKKVQLRTARLEQGYVLIESNAISLEFLGTFVKSFSPGWIFRN